MNSQWTISKRMQRERELEGWRGESERREDREMHGRETWAEKEGSKEREEDIEECGKRLGMSKDR